MHPISYLLLMLDDFMANLHTKLRLHSEKLSSYTNFNGYRNKTQIGMEILWECVTHPNGHFNELICYWMRGKTFHFSDNWRSIYCLIEYSAEKVNSAVDHFCSWLNNILTIIALLWVVPNFWGIQCFFFTTEVEEIWISTLTFLVSICRGWWPRGCWGTT